MSIISTYKKNREAFEEKCLKVFPDGSRRWLRSTYPEDVEEHLSQSQVSLLEAVVELAEEKKRHFPIQKVDGNPVSWKNGYNQALTDSISLLQHAIKEIQKEQVK